MEKASVNTTYPTNVQKEFKEIYQNLNVYFEKHENISSRLSFLVQETERVYKIDNTFNKYFESIDFGDWGYIFELLFVYKIVSFNLFLFFLNYFLGI